MSARNEKNIAAVLEGKGARLTITTRPIPNPGPHEIVVRNHAVAVNPVDWKIQDYGFTIKTYPVVIGSDGAGIITSIGSSVTGFKVGDRVTGFAGSIYNNDPNQGAYQNYTILRDIATTKLPDSMSFEEGSVFPMAMATAAVAFFTCMSIPRPIGLVKPQESGMLIWGASSSVGTSALQLAKTLGFKVSATASPAHHSYLKSLGAFEVFDYRSPTVVEDIIAAAKSAGIPIKYGFDSIAEGETSKLSADVVKGSGGGKLVLVLAWNDKFQKPDGVEVSQTAALRTGTDQEELGKWFFNEYLENALQDGSIVSAPKIEIVPGGLGATQAAFDISKKGVSGKKLVLKAD
jgi:NADPH:quinone reductase-like Zn-dependent oxidoreductase